jgi:hypothetical protein
MESRLLSFLLTALRAMARSAPIVVTACAQWPILAGCGSDATAGSASDLTVTPTGTDILPGKLLVVAPPNARTLPTIKIFDRNSTSPASFGQSVELRPGTYCVEFADDTGAGDACGISIESMRTTTYDRLGVVTYSGPQASAPDGWEFLNDPMPVHSLSDPKAASYPHDQFGTVSVRVASKYHANFGPLFDGIDYEVAPGQLFNVDLSSFEQRRAARLLPPASKELPDAPACSGSSVHISGSKGGSERSADVPVQTPILIGEHALGANEPAGAYTLSMSHSPKVEIALPFSPNAGDAARPLQLARIDVKDVTVTENDGTKTQLRGTYKIEQVVVTNGLETFRETCARGEPTMTGVTLVPGKYRVSTTFPTHDNSTPHVQVVTVP